MLLVLQILRFVLVLSFLVVIHELGHFVVARLAKVKVEEFGLGYPPRAKKLFTRMGTVFTLNWVPFGGFVKLEGEDGGNEKATNSATAFYHQPARSRLAIILAGAFVNFLFGMVAFSIYFSTTGIPILRPRIDSIAPNSPAAAAHVPANVEITGLLINGQRVLTPTVDDVTGLIGQHLGGHVTLVTSGPCADFQCDHHEQTFPVYLRTKSETPTDQGALGIAFLLKPEQKFYPWYQMPFRGIVFGVKQAFVLIQFILSGLAQVATTAAHGQIPPGVAGPVGIFRQAKDAGFLSSGFLDLLYFAGLLSVNLAVMNVLPIPALDGGRALFIVLEKIIGKHRVHQFEGMANYGGMALLMALILFITAHDIIGIFKQ